MSPQCSVALLIAAAAVSTASTVLGEWLGLCSYAVRNRLLSLLIDNAAHGVVAACCWTGAILCLATLMRADGLSYATTARSLSLTPSWLKRITGSEQQLTALEVLFQLGLAYFCGCVLDADHFVAARSFHFRDAASLPSGSQRPFGHAVLFIVASSAAASFLLPQLSPVLPVMIFTSLFSHQLRDSIRRGLWLWPFGSTRPIPFRVYALAMALLPLMAGFIMKRSLRDAASLHYVPPSVEEDGSAVAVAVGDADVGTVAGAGGVATRRFLSPRAA
jgi:hypothetical protein